jgi:hypothetical protein
LVLFSSEKEDVLFVEKKTEGTFVSWRFVQRLGGIGTGVRA